MGLVFAAYDPLLDRTVAIKLLRHEVATAMTHSARLRMLREARAMARLAHPNVVAVHDAGLFQERVYLAMECLEGGNLAEWLKVRPRTWKEIRDVFVQAGRGLAAAHAMGMVHRDFKPQNVLFGPDGRVRISDFGLVRPLGERQAKPGAENVKATSPGAHHWLQATSTTGHGPLTCSGTVLGTPGYIAPEQLQGAEPDSRADQYSFCAALHLALYGRLPGKSPEEAPRGPLVPARVPEWLGRLVAKGLAREPAARFPTMDALLEELDSRDRKLRRRSIGLAALVATLATGSVVAVAALREPSQCRDLAERQAEAWGPERREAVRLAFARSGVVVSGESWKHVGRALDRYAAGWHETYAGVCRAQRTGRSSTSDAVAFSGTAACLDARLDELGQLVRVLSSATALMVREDAARAVSELLPPEACLGSDRLAGQVPPPPVEVAERVRAIRQSLGEAWALYRAGDQQRAASVVEGLVPDARSARYPPVLAETLALAGKLRGRMGRPREASAALNEAVLAAEATGKQLLAAELATEIADVLVHQGPEQHHLARAALDHGEALLAHLGGNASLEAKLLQARATTLAVSGYWRDAVPLLERAARLTEESFGPSHPRTAAAMLSLAKEMKAAEDHDRARTLAERGHRIYEEIHGPDHPDSLSAIHALGQLARDRGDFRLELDLARKALAGRLTLYGERSVEVAGGRWNLASALSNLGDIAGALEQYRQALVIFEALYGASGERDLQIAALHGNVGLSHFLIGEDQRAMAAFQRELDIHLGATGPDDPKLVHPLSNLGLLAAVSGRPAEAESYFQRAITVARATGEDNADLQCPYELRGMAEYEAGRYERARQSFLAALPYARITAPDGSAALALFESNLAAAELGAGEVDAALARATSALEVIERAVGVDQPLSARALTTVGEAHRRKGHLKQAVAFLERAASIRRAHPCRPAERAETFLALEKALQESGQPSGRARSLHEVARVESRRSSAPARSLALRGTALDEMRH